MSNPSIPLPQFQGSSPSLQVPDALLGASNPSIRRRNVTFRYFALVFFVIVALCALVLTVFLFVEETERIKKETARAEENALIPRRLNVQAVSVTEAGAASAEDSAIPSEDDLYMHFSLFSTPSGADVYRDGLFMGRTPIEQVRLPKGAGLSYIVVALDGYEIARKTVRMSENFSDAIQLAEAVHHAKAAKAPAADDGVRTNRKAPAADDGVRTNRAVVITTQAGRNAHGNTKGRGGAKANTAADMGIALPD